MMDGSWFGRVTRDFRGEFRFLCPTEVFYRRGIAGELAARCKARGWQRVLVVSDVRVAETAAGDVLATAGDSGLEVDLWAGIDGEPTDAMLSSGVERIRRSRPDAVIAIGGGSVLDAAKVLAVAGAHPTGEVAWFLKPSSFAIEKTLPLVTMPTTAGTGAEITRGTVVLHPDTGVKRGFSRGGCYAQLALLDPALTDKLPRAVTASSGLDAFCHALESYLSPTAFPIGDLLSLGALTLHRDHFAGALAGGQPASRDAMMMCAHFAALAFSTGGGLTFSHLFSDYAATAAAPAPHAFVAALLLPAVVHLAEEGGNPRIGVLRELFGTATLLEAVQRVLSLAGAPDIGTVLERREAEGLARRTLEGPYAGGYTRADAETIVATAYALAA